MRKYIVQSISIIFLCTLMAILGVLNVSAATYKYSGSLEEVEDPSYGEKDLVVFINNDTVIVPKEKYDEWKEVNSYLRETTWSEEGIKEFINVLNEKYVVYDEIKFITHDFYEVPIGNNSITQEINVDTAYNDIKTALKYSDNKIVRLYATKADKEKKGTYIEVSLDEQMIFYYREGVLVLSSKCVSGSVNPDHQTSQGTFQIYSKENGRYLEGTNDDGSKYKRWVDYWMPFNGGQGFHDASWRNEFGGDIYKWGGSHGCINLPYDIAQQLYNNVEVGCDVYIYDLSGVRAANTGNTTLSKSPTDYIDSNGDLIITIQDSYSSQG